MTEKPPWMDMVRGHVGPVMERVLDRLNRGEAPPSVTLPESKREFPKLLYLDTWVWVAVDSGITSHAVASALGHESFKTTAESYAKREAVAGAQQKRALAVLTGGRLAS